MTKLYRQAPGKSCQEGITLTGLYELFPDEITARRWFESILWLDGLAVCHRCNGTNTYEVNNGKPLPHKCRDCRRHFSVRYGTILERSHIPLRKWAIAIYLIAASLKDVSSMKLHRDLGITQKSAWHMLHKIRYVMSSGNGQIFGAVNVDETCKSGLEKNTHVELNLHAERDQVSERLRNNDLVADNGLPNGVRL